MNHGCRKPNTHVFVSAETRDVGSRSENGEDGEENFLAHRVPELGGEGLTMLLEGVEEVTGEVGRVRIDSESGEKGVRVVNENLEWEVVDGELDGVVDEWRRSENWCSNIFLSNLSDLTGFLKLFLQYFPVAACY